MAKQRTQWLCISLRRLRGWGEGWETQNTIPIKPKLAHVVIVRCECVVSIRTKANRNICWSMYIQYGMKFMCFVVDVFVVVLSPLPMRVYFYIHSWRLCKIFQSIAWSCIHIELVFGRRISLKRERFGNLIIAQLCNRLNCVQRKIRSITTVFFENSPLNEKKEIPFELASPKCSQCIPKISLQ